MWVVIMNKNKNSKIDIV